MPEENAWRGIGRGEKRLFSADSKHGLWFAVDSDGKPMLLVTHSTTPPARSALPELKGVDVFSQRAEGQAPARLGLRLLCAEHRDLFEHLCRDVAQVAALAETEAGAVSMFLNRMHRWHALLRRGSGRLSREEQKGLFGELYFLESVPLELYSPLFAVQTWQGPSGEPKDFAFGQIGVECKTKSASGRDHVRISSEHQLDLEGLDQLFLFVLDLAPAPADHQDGETLQGLVERLRRTLAHQDEAAVDVLNRRLESLGYRHEDDYTEFTWLTQRSRQYSILDGFPRIIPGSLAAAVDNVTYRLDLTECEPWLQEKEVFRSTIIAEASP